MSNIQPSSSLLPAHFKDAPAIQMNLMLQTHVKSEPFDPEDSGSAIENRKSDEYEKTQDAWGISDDETVSVSSECYEATLTADDTNTDRDIDSDSTVFNENVFKVKDETLDSDEDNSSKGPDSSENQHVADDPKFDMSAKSENDISPDEKDANLITEETSLYSNSELPFKNEHGVDPYILFPTESQEENNCAFRTYLERSLTIADRHAEDEIDESTRVKNDQVSSSFSVAESVKLNSFSPSCSALLDSECGSNSCTENAKTSNNVESVALCQENGICDKNLQNTLPAVWRTSDDKTKSIENDVDYSAKDLLEFSGYFLKFSKNDIEKCLHHIDVTYPTKKFSPLLYSEKARMTAWPEKTNNFSKMKGEFQNMSHTEETKSLENSHSDRNKNKEMFTGNEAAMKFEEKFNVARDSFKIADQDKREIKTENLSAKENDDDKEIRFSRIILEVIKASMCRASEMNTHFENAPLVNPRIRSADGNTSRTPAIQVEEQKVDSTAIPEPLASESLELNSKLSSVEKSTFVTSKSELQKIMETAPLLNNPLFSSRNKPSPLKYPSTDMREDRNKESEIEEIIIDCEIFPPRSSNANIPKVIQDSTTPVITIDDVQLIKIKKKRRALQKPLNSVLNRSNYSEITKEDTVKNKGMINENVPKHQCDIVNVLDESDTSQMVADVNEMRSVKENAVLKTYPNIIPSKDSPIRIENIDEFSNQIGENRDIQNNFISEPPLKKTKISPIACEDNIIQNHPKSKSSKVNTSKKISRAASNRESGDEIPFQLSGFMVSCISIDGERKMEENKLSSKEKVRSNISSVDSNANKRKMVDDGGNKKMIKLSSEERPNVSIFDRSGKNDSQHPPISFYRKHPIRHPAVSSTNTIYSSTNSSDQTQGSVDVKCSKMSVIENKRLKPSILKKEFFSSDANNSSEQTNPEKYQVKFHNRKKKNRISSLKTVFQYSMNINDLASHILDWNADWLLTEDCAPICDSKIIVKNSYKSELEYYNTYFPLHLRSIWLGICDTWKKCPVFFDSVFENQEETPSFVKITLLSVLSEADCSNWPNQEDIVLCRAVKSDGSQVNLFGRVSNVVVKDYNPPNNSILKGTGETPAFKRIKFELFCAELLDVPLLTTVKVKILNNIRIPLLQNDALQLRNKYLKDIVLDPKTQASRWKFIPLHSQGPKTFGKCMERIFTSLTSSEIRITVVDTPPPTDVILTISLLVAHLKSKHSPVLIGFKSKEAFMELARRLKSCVSEEELILAIKSKDVKLPEELQKYCPEDVSPPIPNFRNWHVTLTLLSSVSLGCFSNEFSEQNSTCIVHEAHLCTEVETALLLYYEVKNLVLMGNKVAKTDMLNNHPYDISLFQRFCEIHEHLSTDISVSRRRDP